MSVRFRVFAPQSAARLGPLLLIWALCAAVVCPAAWQSLSASLRGAGAASETASAAAVAPTDWMWERAPVRPEFRASCSRFSRTAPRGPPRSDPRRSKRAGRSARRTCLSFFRLHRPARARTAPRHLGQRRSHSPPARHTRTFLSPSPLAEGLNNRLRPSCSPSRPASYGRAFARTIFSARYLLCTLCAGDP